MRSKKNVFLFVGMVAFLISCNRMEVAPESDLNFYPLIQNQERVYQVDSIHYNAFTKSIDTFSYFVLEKIEGFYADSPQQTWILNKYIAFDTNQNWTLSAQFLINKTQDWVKRKEYNTDYMPLIFPILERKSWNYNNFNKLEVKVARYLNVDAPLFVNAKEYPRTCEVFIEDDSNFFEQKKHIAYYGRQIGLLQKLKTDIIYQNKEPHGYKLTYTLIKHD